MKPPVWFSLILAIQELSCLLFLCIVIFYAKYTIFKNIIRCHSTGSIQSKPGTFSPDWRLSLPKPDPQGPTCLTRVLHTCTTSFNPLDFNLWIHPSRIRCRGLNIEPLDQFDPINQIIPLSSAHCYTVQLYSGSCLIWSL